MEFDEYFQYTPSPNATYGLNAMSRGNSKSIKLAKDAVTYCTSGLVDRNKNTVLSYLHKAIKALNQLRMIEDSLVIYRLSRAPERRIFYIDVGNLPKVKAEQYLKEVMSRYRNKLAYNAQTGEVRDDRKFMSMMEDFWLPRRKVVAELRSLPCLAVRIWENSLILNTSRRNSIEHLVFLNLELLLMVDSTSVVLLRF